MRDKGNYLCMHIVLFVFVFGEVSALLYLVWSTEIRSIYTVDWCCVLVCTFFIFLFLCTSHYYGNFLHVSESFKGRHYDNIFIHYKPVSGWDYEWI